MEALSSPLVSFSKFLCHVLFALPQSWNSSLTEHKLNHSKQISSFFLKWKCVCFFQLKKKGNTFPPPQLPYQWRAGHWCVYLKLSWLWDIAVFIVVSVCGSTHFQHGDVCVCVSAFICDDGDECQTPWCVICCDDGKGEAVGLEGDVLLLFGLYKHLL